MFETGDVRVLLREARVCEAGQQLSQGLAVLGDQSGVQVSGVEALHLPEELGVVHEEELDVHVVRALSVAHHRHDGLKRVDESIGRVAAKHLVDAVECFLSITFTIEASTGLI